MIYQLVKRDISWKTACALAAVCPLAALVGFWQPGKPAGFFLFWLISFVMLTLVAANRRCTIFEAALPISGRDLYCARLLLNLISIWLPVLGAAATILAFANPANASLIFNFGAILTVGVIGIQAAQPQRFAAPGWWQFTIGAISIFAAVFAVDIQLPAVLLICATASAMLLLMSWLRVPAALQIAPARPQVQRLQNFKLGLPLPVWFPIVRTLFPLNKGAVPMLALIAGFGLLGGGYAGSFLGLLWILTVWAQSFAALDRLLALPIRRRTLFWVAGISPLGIYMLANLIGSYIFRQPFEMVLFALIVSAVIGLFGLLASELPYAYLPRVPSKYRLIPGLVFVASVFICRYWLPPRSASGDRTNLVVPQLFNVFSENRLLMTAAAAVIAGILYWLAYQVFGRIEATRRVRQVA